MYICSQGKRLYFDFTGCTKKPSYSERAILKITWSISKIPNLNVAVFISWRTIALSVNPSELNLYTPRPVSFVSQLTTLFLVGETLSLTAAAILRLDFLYGIKRRDGITHSLLFLA